MDISVPFLISYAVGISASLVLSVYFFFDFASRKLRVSLAWAIGLLLYSIGLTADLMVDIGREVTLGKPGLFVALLVVAFSMTLLYYGASLLFFQEKSFFREKMTGIIFLIYVVYFGYLVAVLPVEGFRQAVVAPIQLGLMTPVFLVIALLFYSISRNLTPGDPAKKASLLVSAAWGLLVINSACRGLFLEYSVLSDTLIQGLHIVAWILLLYGMSIGKATKT